MPNSTEPRTKKVPPEFPGAPSNLAAMVAGDIQNRAAWAHSDTAQPNHAINAGSLSELFLPVELTGDSGDLETGTQEFTITACKTNTGSAKAAMAANPAAKSSLADKLERVEVSTQDERLRKELRCVTVYEHYLEELQTVKAYISKNKPRQREPLRFHFSYLELWKPLSAERIHEIQNGIRLKAPYQIALEATATHERLAGITKRTITNYRKHLRADHLIR